MLQDLDDPLPLANARAEQRQAVLSRGRALRRRRRARVLGIPAAAAAVAASAVLAVSFAPSPSGDAVQIPAAPPPPELVIVEDEFTWEALDGGCYEPQGDSAGEPDVTMFSFDSPSRSVFVHYHWKPGPLHLEGLVELRFEATSADGRRSRQLIARTTADGEVVEQFVRDPRTGARRDLPHATEGPQDGGMDAIFPRGALSGLGDGWTWEGSISVNGNVVDSCDWASGVSPYS